MTLDEFNKEIENYKKGTYTPIVYRSRKEVKGHLLTKVSNGVVRLGLSYASMHKEKVVGALPYGKWMSERLNFIIDKGNGTYDLRCYTSKNHKHKTHCKYYVDGKQVDKETYNLYLGKDSTSIHIELFNVKLENVIKIGK